MSTSTSVLLVIYLLGAWRLASSFTLNQKGVRTSSTQIDRKKFISNSLGFISVAGLSLPLPAQAKNQGPSAQDEVAIIVEASETLTTLLDNWEKATIDCTYADVPRELLETKNKEQLLEKASTFALFDKSTSVVSCKKTNRIVRDYIGVTGKGPLVNVDKRLLRKNVVELVDPDFLDDYFVDVEIFQVTLSRASTATYAAGMSDLDAINNFEKGQQRVESDSNLEQARRAIIEARDCVQRLVKILETSQS
uniref:Uncharacterized protein n=1 Tax=Chaetoceros debilis TaxID=122233 RepID=A0A7S3PWG6_9STRA